MLDEVMVQDETNDTEQQEPRMTRPDRVAKVIEIAHRVRREFMKDEFEIVFKAAVQAELHIEM